MLQISKLWGSLSDLRIMCVNFNIFYFQKSLNSSKKRSVLNIQKKSFTVQQKFAKSQASIPINKKNYFKSLGPKNYQNKKIVSWASGIDVWPLIPTWISTPPLGSNGIHFIEFPHQMRKFLLNLALGEPLALVQELPCFDDSIKMEPLLSSALDLCVHNLITGFLLYAFGVELCWHQLFCYV